MKLTLRNVSDGSVSFFLGGRPPFDFVVSTADGEQVWHWKCAKITLLPLDSKMGWTPLTAQVRGQIKIVDCPYRPQC